ncbi:tWiK family of potassium channels protein 18 [Elysia marginata]|uniref:TWiK family of potassium channels protein 18 n=1 Tax=Elysia marginata TaxID=1093978 RepID=A0AAV4IMV7_9GAST|nr:tWiK family of potassium channels protein 18 [Elysia marginata]
MGCLCRCCRYIFYYLMRALTSAFGLATVNTVYLLTGACIFFLIEGPNEATIFTNLQADRKFLVNQLYSIVNGGRANQLSLKDEYAKISEALGKYETTLATFYRKRTIVGKNNALNDSGSSKLWTEIGSVIYAFSVVTTIGWGNIVPTTVHGRMATIFYGFVGIPLLFTLSSEVGAFTTKVIRLISYAVSKLCCSGQPLEDKSMNRPMNKPEDIAVDGAIRLETRSAFDSGYINNLPNWDFPPGHGDGFLKSANITHSKGDFQEDIRGGGDYVSNNNRSYLKTVDSTMDFLLEISRNPSIWRGGEVVESSENGSKRDEGLPRHGFSHDNFIDILNKPRYRLSTDEDAELLSQQLGRLPLEDFCRIMTLVGFNFEKDILLEGDSDSDSEGSSYDMSLETKSEDRQKSRGRSRENTEKRGENSDRLFAEEQMTVTRHEQVETQYGNNYELDSTRGDGGGDTFTLQDENVEVKKRKRSSATSIESQGKQAFNKGQLAFKSTNVVGAEAGNIFEEKTGAFILYNYNLHMLGGGECYNQRHNGYENIIRNGDEKNFNTTSPSVIMGGGDDIVSRDVAYTSVRADARVQTLDQGDRILLQNLVSTESTPLDSGKILFSEKTYSEAALKPPSTQQADAKHLIDSKPIALNRAQEQNQFKVSDPLYNVEGNPLSAISCTDLMMPSIHESLPGTARSTTTGTIAETHNTFLCLPEINTQRSSDPQNFAESCAGYFSEKPFAYHKSSKQSSRSHSFGCLDSILLKKTNSVTHFDEMVDIKQKLEKLRLTLSQEVSDFSKSFSSNTSRENNIQNKMQNCEISFSCPSLLQKPHTEWQSPPMNEEAHHIGVPKHQESEPQEASAINEPSGWETPVQRHFITEADTKIQLLSPDIKNCPGTVGYNIESACLFPYRSKCEENALTSSSKLSVKSSESASCISHTTDFLTHHIEEQSPYMPHDLQIGDELFSKPNEGLQTQIKRLGQDLTLKYIDKSRSTLECNEIPSTSLEVLATLKEADCLHQAETYLSDELKDKGSLYQSKMSPADSILIRGPFALHTISDIDKHDHENKLSTVRKASTRSNLKNMKSTPVHARNRGETIDRFLSISDAIEIKANSLPKRDHGEDATFFSQSPGPVGETCKTPVRSFGLGLLAKEDSLCDLKPNTGNQKPDECNHSMFIPTHHAKRLLRCQKWVEQSYPFICERERRKVERFGDPNCKLSKNKSILQKNNMPKTCDQSSLSQSLSYRRRIQLINDRFTNTSRHKRVKKYRTDRRAYTVRWLGEHNMFDHISLGFPRIGCKEQKLILRQHSPKGIPKNVSKMTERCHFLTKENSEDSRPYWRSKLNDKNRRSDDVSERNGFGDEKQQLDQNFNKKGKGDKRDKDRKGGKSDRGESRKKERSKGSPKDKRKGDSRKGRDRDKRRSSRDDGERRGGKGDSKGRSRGGDSPRRRGRDDSKRRSSRDDSERSGRDDSERSGRDDGKRKGGQDDRKGRSGRDDTDSKGRGGGDDSRRRGSRDDSARRRPTTDDAKHKGKVGGRKGSVSFERKGGRGKSDKQSKRGGEADGGEDSRRSSFADEDSHTEGDGRRGRHGQKDRNSPSGRRKRHPAIFDLFGVKKKKKRRRRDRWARYRPRDKRTLDEDLAVLKATIGEASAPPPVEEEDVEVPLIFVYFGMCLFIVLGGLANEYLIENISTAYEGFYFVYVLCSTIGFGDFVPDESSYLFELIYGLTGVSMFNITVNATLQYMVATLDYLKAVVKKP